MAVPSDYIDRVFVDALGHTGNTYYYRLVRRSDGAIWDYTAQEFSLTTTWLNSAHIMAETGTTGQFPVIIDKDLPASSVCYVIIYKQGGAAPAKTDAVETEYSLRHGSIFGF